MSTIIKPQYAHEFPDFDNAEAFEAMLAALAPMGFVDASWHNDVCPSIGLCRPSGDRILAVYVDYNARELREYPDLLTTYFVNHYKEDGDYSEECREFVSFDEAVAHIKAAYMEADTE